MIVGPHPAGREVLHLVDAVEVILGQPLVTHGPIEPLDVRILLRLAGLDVLDLDPSPVSLGLELAADVLWAVVAPDRQRLAAPRDDLLQASDHAQCRQ